MAAIFVLPHTQTQDSIPSSPSVLPDPKNMGVAVRMSLLSLYELRYTYYPIYFRLMAAIFDLWHTQT